MRYTDTSKTVLVLDDDADILTLLGASLEEAGFVVVTASTISDARDAIKKHDFALFLVDVRLPDGNGSLFAQEIRATSSVGIIIVTAFGDSVDRIVGLELGADDYISKPFNHRELRARANAVLRRSTRALDDVNADGGSSGGKFLNDPDPVIEFHGYTLDKPARSLVNIHGVTIDLTTLEFDALAALAANKNIVMSRAEIYETARLRKGDPGRMVDGLVSRLRKKLYDDDVAKIRIRTVHNRGYVLSE